MYEAEQSYGKSLVSNEKLMEIVSFSGAMSGSSQES